MASFWFLCLKRKYEEIVRSENADKINSWKFYGLAKIAIRGLEVYLKL